LKLTKTHIASALLIVFTATSNVMAQEAIDTKQNNIAIESDFMATAEGNVIIIWQTAPFRGRFW
jgi:hypothetical protein